MATQPPVVELSLGGTGKSFDRETSALALHAESKESATHVDLSRESAEDLTQFARGAGSSLHVPIEYEGHPATLNFWSKETNAFPEEAKALLRDMAALAAPPGDD